jgi:hypothetical protein
MTDDNLGWLEWPFWRARFAARRIAQRASPFASYAIVYQDGSEETFAGWLQYFRFRRRVAELREQGINLVCG